MIPSPPTWGTVRVSFAGASRPIITAAAASSSPAIQEGHSKQTTAESAPNRDLPRLKSGPCKADPGGTIPFTSTLKRARSSTATAIAPSPAESGRKDVYRLRDNGSVTLKMQFRDWGGMFMEHCHNTMHEDNAMLLRWDLDSGTPFLSPLPTPISKPTGVTFETPDEILPNA